MPDLPGLEMAARYLPSEQTGVSGDWYDVFSLDSGALGIVIGDVVGHGLRAAVVMGRLRSALRAYALDNDDPAEVVTKLDRKIQHFEPGVTATVAYLIVAPSRDSFRISLAGHPPPVLAGPDGTGRLLRVTPDLPLGVGVPRARHTHVVPLPPSGLLCLYTDGLIERRDRPISSGIGELCSLLDTSSAARACASAVTTMIGSRRLTDDAAVFALRRADPAR
ncbi:hypothetical protein Athai_60700 [Actinocatenispora thailandica]|uniref:PPM-type phosphatase domain-containing protein n=1 Tax=Actinocatenispora thailandica TaxID=227318 RepID=A0A7R7DWB8_9ACTN|nr:hypothetical protein Athai_60700 [Actinocatenispora thailandica]